MSNNPNHQENILVNQDYMQDNQEIGPIEINDEYYHDQNEQQQQDIDENDHHDEEYDEQGEHEQGDDDNNEDQAYNLQNSARQQMEGINQAVINYQGKMQEIQNQIQHEQPQKANFKQYQIQESHIREQTEEDHYDEQIINDGHKKQYDELDNDEQYQQQYKQMSQEKNQEYKQNIQQKRYNQPQQFIEYKTSPRNAGLQQYQESESNYQLDESSDQNQNRPQKHYFDGQQKNIKSNQKNSDKAKHIKNASESLTSQLDNVSNIMDDHSKSLVRQIKQDESQLETSQANVSVNQNNPYDEHAEYQKKHLLDSPGNIELIKHSKYYQKYLNGESLNDSYSILPLQTNNNLPSLQNSTSFVDPKVIATVLDQNLQGNELYILKMKLFESNNKLMVEMNRNRQYRQENSQLKLTIENLQFQLQQASQAISEYEKQIQDFQINSSQQQQQVMMNTFSSPLKSPTFENQGQSMQQSEVMQQKSIQLQEEQNKNYNLRQDLENLRTRLLQEMNNSNQYEQQVRDQEQIIKDQQNQIQEKNSVISSKSEEIRKLLATSESYRIEIQNLNINLSKSKQAQDDIQRQKNEQVAEFNYLISENKQLQAKLQNYNQDNLRLFSEIQILKQKLEKSDNQVVIHQNQIYNQKIEQSQQQTNYVSNKHHNTTIEKLQLEISELKSNLIATSQQLELQQERNDYLSVRLEEAEKLNKQFNSQKPSQNVTKTIKQQSPPKYRNESELEYQQRLLEHQMLEKQHKLERDFQQKQLELMTQYAVNQNTVKQIHGGSHGRVDKNEKTVKQSEQHHEQHQRSRNTDEHNQQYASQQLRQSYQQNSNYYSQNQNINPNQHHPHHNIQNYASNKSESNSHNQQQISKQQQHNQESLNQYKQNQNQQVDNNRFSSPPPKNIKQNIPPNHNHDYLFYQDIEEEKQKLQNQPQYIPIGVTSVNENAYVSNTQRIKDLDLLLNQLLQKKKLAESELLKLEESKRKSSLIIIQKQELEERIRQYSQEISNVKNQLRNLHALK
ncbi:hypothetical protein TTHERM_00006110 (macronuclear) [Tetrahymena thermophila SB210]|uniref:Uncharacterized protein n=1 Tax=Tetrahymena thermophila (strain SB210) TaxID=312017 RepID=Q22SC5_TETTS|nr:hypothetical protein TTHERM_00006110 [Tetrahymena thermophila SB210]EAR87847.2 hypothetical protein TTHERM_00006110 [Tetrahymena thermophila SB210]|eukprot:XP_001008092.2 hypothetical protein TTHERM_00006110 [Tetrahymena thermophila SB210]